MSNLSIYQEDLPSNIDDLSKFVLVGREKMVAVRAEIRAIDKLGLAEGVRRQKLEEAQMISEAVLDAEVKIGTLTANIPKSLFKISIAAVFWSNLCSAASKIFVLRQ